MPASRFGSPEARRTVSNWTSTLGEDVFALIVGTFVLAVFVCLAAIDPATWTFQRNVASHIRSELSHCFSIQDSDARLGCYDHVASRLSPYPAKGANPFSGTFGQQNR
jgi:hypothetical protein